jgi:hypothetical protein
LRLAQGSKMAFNSFELPTWLHGKSQGRPNLGVVALKINPAPTGSVLPRQAIVFAKAVLAW